MALGVSTTFSPHKDEKTSKSVLSITDVACFQVMLYVLEIYRG